MLQHRTSALLLGDSLASSWFVRLLHRLTPWPRIVVDCTPFGILWMRKTGLQGVRGVLLSDHVAGGTLCGGHRVAMI